MSSAKFGFVFVICAATVLLARAGAATADDTKLREEKLATVLGETVVNAVHPTGKKVGYLKHELTDDGQKPNCKILKVKMQYFGAVTEKKYVADIEIEIQIGIAEWEVIRIDYRDNNTSTKYNQENIQQVKRKLGALGGAAAVLQPRGGDIKTSAIRLTRSLEGGYSNNPNDKGGPTNFGITTSTYDGYRLNKKLPKQPVSQITQDEVNEIYSQFWRDSVL